MANKIESTIFSTKKILKIFEVWVTREVFCDSNSPKSIAKHISSHYICVANNNFFMSKNESKNVSDCGIDIVILHILFKKEQKK